MLEQAKIVYRKIVHAGVDEAAPPALIDRIIFSNLACVYGTVINLLTALVNLAAGYYLLLGINFLYQQAMVLCFLLNLRRRYLLARTLLLLEIYIGMFFTGLIQGPDVGIHLYFFPLGVLAFSLFYAEERKFGLAFLVLAMAFFLFLVSQDGPVLSIDPHRGAYTAHDLFVNRLGSVTLFVAFLFSLSSAFNRALVIIESQRNKIFEERRLAAVGTVAFNVAHEINSPLAALNLQLFQLENALKKEAPPAALEQIARAKKTAQRISVIVKGLKFLNSKDSSDPFTRCAVQSLVDSALDLCEERFRRMGVRLEQDLESHRDGLPCRPVALSQVLVNLLNNAVDAVAHLPAERRWVRLEGRIEGRFYRFLVADGGFPIPEDVRSHLFGKFFTTKPPGEGTGLGLHISRETVEAHGGTLVLDVSRPHTAFVITLPAGEGAR